MLRKLYEIGCLRLKKLTEATWEYLRQAETSRDYLRLIETTWDYLRRAKTNGDYLRLTETTQDYLRLPETS